MLLSTVWTKFGSVVSQIALGWLLLPEDFGLFATAGAVALLARAFQDGGVRDLLVQRGRAYRAIADDAFWLALAINVTIAALLFVASPIVARAYGQPRLVGMLGVIALSVPMGTPWTVMSSKLQIDFRFRSWASILMLGAIIQHAGMVLFAWLGFGALSFVLPLPIMSVAMSAAGWLVTRETPWLSRPNRETWRPILSETKWLMLAAAAAALFTQGDYLVVGTIVSTSVLGVYYFAYQIPGQVGGIAVSIGDILLPVLVGAAESPHRQRLLLVRALELLSVAVSAACVLIAVLIPRIETLVWADRWEEAVVPMQIMALLMPYRLIFIVPKVALLSRGRFQTLSLAVLAQGLGLMLAAAVGALISPNARLIALFVGSYLAVSVMLFTIVVLRGHGVSPLQVLSAVIRAWLVAATAGAVAHLAGTYDGPNASSAILLAIQILAYAATFVIVARLFLSSSIRSFLDLLDGSTAARLRRLLMLQT